MITIHVVFNAHLDPIWLWPWQASLGELLATCRSACDRLDNHKDAVFTRGEAWVYAQIERMDAKLFERIRKHVAGGQWEIVGGWWLQPDCNLPSGFGMEKQIALGKKYFLERFGKFPEIAYNVDSFGHAATLPGYMRAAGQDKYVMMRPQEHEMKLPARLFRWRGYEGGPEVTVFRIAGQYNHVELSEWAVHQIKSELPEGVTDTMAFMGIGDHGGGPTEKMIEKLREAKDKFAGCRLVFSSPGRFFKAIEKHIPKLPVVTGELQQHAIGCFSVHRGVKVGVRRAEHLLHMAEVMDEGRKLDERESGRMEEAWEKVCFTQFHDTLGGTCIPTAYVQVGDHLGFAGTVGDEALRYGLERRMGAMAGDEVQRLVMFNASEEAWEGHAETEPWLQWSDWPSAWHVVDEKGKEVPTQRVGAEAAVFNVVRILFRVKVAGKGTRVFRIKKGKAPEGKGAKGKGDVVMRGERMENGLGVGVEEGVMRFGKERLGVRLDLIEDPTDTWSHGFDRYDEGPAENAVWNGGMVVDRGPLMGAVMQTGRIGESTLKAEWRVYAGEAFVELKLLVHWGERRKVLKLVVPLAGEPEERTDGIMGGSLVRKNDGKERPVRDWMLVGMGGKRKLGIVCPDVFAADGTDGRVRLTLLRSPLLAHHDPWRHAAPRARVADQGEHEFRFRFYLESSGGKVMEKVLEQQGLMAWRPLVVGDLTRGMKASAGWWA